MRCFNTSVYIEYSGSLEDGTVFDENKGTEPLKVLLGAGSVPRDLEDALLEMELGEERVVCLLPPDAFGEYNSEAVLKVPLNTIPHAEDLPIGGYIQLANKETGAPAYAKVLKVEGGHAVLDLNHPLASRALTYRMRIVKEDPERMPVGVNL